MNVENPLLISDDELARIQNRLDLEKLAKAGFSDQASDKISGQPHHYLRSLMRAIILRRLFFGDGKINIDIK